MDRVEKDYHHIKTNIASQKEKLVENYRREHEKLIIRQNDLNKQLGSLEERFKVRITHSFFLSFFLFNFNEFLTI